MSEGRVRFVVPEVVQTSAMDCGPAALVSLLAGFGIHASYGRLREACQTAVDGTSIDAIEDTAVQLGLRAAQIMLPVDHVLIPEAAVLPAIAIVRLPNGGAHFVVAWRRHGRLVQVMDPAAGRRWPSCRRFAADLYVHEARVPASAWRQSAASATAVTTLRARLADQRIDEATVARVVAHADADPDWWPLASVDAAARMSAALVRAGALARGAEATRLFERTCQQAIERGPAGPPVIPQEYWSVRPASTRADHDQLLYRGAVLVTVEGPAPRAGLVSHGDADTNANANMNTGSASVHAEGPAPELAAVTQDPPQRPWRTLARLLRDQDTLAVSLLIPALALAALGVILEAVLFRGLFSLGSHLALVGQRAGAMFALAALVATLLLVELHIGASALRLGRRLEAALRIRFLEKIPRLGDRYFRSRPISDMTERVHSIHAVRSLPDLGARALRALFELLLTAAAIAWIMPSSAVVAVAAATLAVILPLIAQPMLLERDLRVRTHAGALARFHLDALLGLIPVRTHSAERALRRDHEALLTGWMRAARGLQYGAVLVEGAQIALGFGLAAWLLFTHLGRGGDAGSTLLLAYWALNLPVLAQELAQTVRQYPTHRNLALRLIEPLGAREDIAHAPHADSPRVTCGVAIELRQVTVRAGGHPILHDISLTIPSGSHVAIVGASGAGKSSLAGLLLGWHRPGAGQIWVDGEPLDASALDRLRQDSAWVDPAVQIWNRSLLDNLLHGSRSGQAATVGSVVDAADLRDVLEALPDGFATILGESGGLVSGGEGQRVRLARAMMRPDARLVILDEPFSGLERARRHTLLTRARALWRHATLLCITHDISETLAFDRVLVLSAGRICEDGRPTVLAARAGSHYRAMLESERNGAASLASRIAWRRLTLRNGRLHDPEREVVT